LLRFATGTLLLIRQRSREWVSNFNAPAWRQMALQLMVSRWKAPASRSGCGLFSRLVIVQIAVEEAAGFRAGICAAPPTFPLAAAKTDRYCAPVLV